MTIPMNRTSGNSSFQEQDGPMSDGVFGTEGDEMVEDIKATAFNMENGKVVKKSLKKSQIVTTKLDEQNYQVEFTVPDVKEGTVIEYEYKIHSQLFWQLRDWYAQCEIPVVYAKLDMNIPNYLIFNIEDHGIQRLKYTCTVGSLKYKVESDPLALPMTVNTNHYVYIGRDLKGMPKDPYVWNVQDYCAGITAELKQYRLRGMSQMEYARTWEQIDDMILSSDDLGIHLNDHSPLANELKEAGIGAIADLNERAVAVYKTVMGKVKWNGKYELSPALTAETVKNGEGTNADINLLLIQSLKDVGMEAFPVVLRERDKGQLPYNFPSMHKLSTYIVGIAINNYTTVYVDASSAGGWLNVLPEKLLVEKARIISKNKSDKWVNLQSLMRSQTTTVVDAVLSADGKLTGKQTTLYKGQAALRYRQQAGKTDEFAQEAKETTTFERQGTVTDGKITIVPFPTPPLPSNPFTADQRLMPVEFSAEQSQQVVVNITLPEGYHLAEKPEQVSASTLNKGVSGKLYVTEGGNRVQAMYQMDINAVAHASKNYDSLRGLFDMMAKSSNRALIIEK